MMNVFAPFTVFKCTQLSFQETISKRPRVGTGEPGSWMGILTGCVASSNLLNSFDPQFLHLQHRDQKRSQLPRSKISERMCVKGPAQLLAGDKLSGNL